MSKRVERNDVAHAADRAMFWAGISMWLIALPLLVGALVFVVVLTVLLLR